MNYELAKKLQTTLPVCNPELEPIDMLNGEYFPRDNNNFPLTLASLIKTCGEKFLRLEFVIDGGIDGTERLWWAVSRRSLVPEEYQVAGETPEEAIANLWLALNNK